jgi:uncharacterized protein YjbK
VSSDGQREVELKRLLVGPDAGDRLIAALGADVRDEKTQRNHFFDTEDRRLGRARYSVRLRFEDHRAILGAKGPSRAVGASTASRVEAESAVESAEAEALVRGMLDPIETLRRRAPDPAFAALWRGLEAAREGRPLRNWGGFDNVRRVVPAALPGGQPVVVEIDRTRFADGHLDEEVEIELPREDLSGEAEAWLEERARAACIETRASTPKVARFFASLGAE